VHPDLFAFPDALPFLGGQPVTSFGVFMFFAFMTAGFVGRMELARMGYDPEKVWDFVFMAVIGGILGAKIYYLLLNFPRLLESPAEMILSRGGLVWYGGFLLAAALVVWEIHRSKLPLGRMADMAAPALALAYAVGRIGCFMVGDDWGRPTTMVWGVRFPEGQPPTTVASIEAFGISVDPAMVARYGNVLPVHPTQIYEVAISTLIFLLLWRLRRHRNAWGWLFMMWLALAGAERFIVEVFRAKDDRFFGVITMAQIISLLLIAVGVYGMTRLRARVPDPEDGPGPAEATA
jgi:phosphatidylglycerol:prolipoprotein diacylglycerol transferase